MGDAQKSAVLQGNPLRTQDHTFQHEAGQELGKVSDEACDLSDCYNSAWWHSTICQIEIPTTTVHILAFEVFLLYENTHKKGNHRKSFPKNICHFIALDTLQNQSP